MAGPSVKFIKWEVRVSRLPHAGEATVEWHGHDEEDAVFRTDDLEMARATGSSGSDEASLAFEALVDKFWPSLHRFVQSRGYDYHESQDLTQSFFLHLLQSGALSKIDRAKGRLSSFLFAALSNYLCNEWDRRKTFKRGGGAALISLTGPGFWDSDVHVLPDATDWKGAVDRRWAVALTEKVIKKLEKEYAAKGKTSLFSQLEPALFSESAAQPHDRSDIDPGTPEGSARVALHRLRRRFGSLLRNEIARLTRDALEVDEEIRHLFTALP
jgi:RNA polymerase sigma-70 factor (ECF subfamily)